MKIRILHFVTVLLFAFALSACGGHGDHDHDHATQSTEQSVESAESQSTAMGPEFTSAYVCPMHCEGSGSAEPGKCPVCGMDYVAKAEHEADGHAH